MSASVLQRSSLATFTSAQAESVRGALVVVPVGAVEQHGPHLPLGTDAWIATAVAREAVALLDNAFLSETLAVGCSEHHRAFTGTLSLSVDTFIYLICDIAKCLREDGFVPVFLNGHGGNRAPISAALQRLLEQGIDAWSLTYFEVLQDIAKERFPARAVGHACALETSIMQYLYPNLVGDIPRTNENDSEIFPDPSLFGTDKVIRHRRFEEFTSFGFVGDPTLANSVAGEEMFDAAVTCVANQLRKISRCEYEDHSVRRSAFNESER